MTGGGRSVFSFFGSHKGTEALRNILVGNGGQCPSLPLFGCEGWEIAASLRSSQ